MDVEDTAISIDAVFVYGTLKRGQCRERMWPAEPIDIDQGWVRGRLYGRSDYPAMTPGEDRVRGELWRFPAEAMPEILTVLDEIEGTNQPGQADLYCRVVVDVLDARSSFLRAAYAYHYATDPLGDGFHRIQPRGAEVAWPEPSPG
jgi:gamma-glutamylcyclotransferase (GGCT)/AIG2-like uncharacterized protein YtfP